MSSNVRNVTSMMNTGLSGATNTIGTGLRGTGQILNTGIRGTANVLNTGVNTTAGILNTGVSGTAGVIGKASNVLNTGVQGTAGVVNSGVNSTASVLNNGISGTADILNTGVSGVTDVVSSGLNGVSNVITSGINSTSDVVTTGINELEKTFRTLEDYLEPKFLLENVFLYSILVVFLTMYGPRLHPKLPVTIRNLFNNPLFRMIILFLIGYLLNRDFLASLVLAIIFTVTFNILQTQEVVDGMDQTEKFLNYGPPVANCKNYSGDRINKLGVPFYPLSDNVNSANLREGEKIDYQQINLDNPEEKNH